jgi:tetratricopeptide (TPR) repeat protein
MKNAILRAAISLSPLAIWWSGLAVAQQHNVHVTDGELRVLPSYCTARLRGNLEVEKKRWEQTLGNDFIHLHHYCFALHFINKANMENNPEEKGYIYKRAMDNLQYMEKHATKSFVLMPEIYVKHGTVLRLVNRDSEAARKFLKAIELRPSYTPAYSALSDYYLDLGNVEEARRIVEDGLGRSPNSKLLRRKLAELEETKQLKN